MLIKLKKVTRQAYADTGHPAWGGGQLDAREILKPMLVEEIYVNPAYIIQVEPVRVLVGWNPELMPSPCRCVLKSERWWGYRDCSLVHIQQVGKVTVSEPMFEVERLYRAEMER